MKNRIRVLEGLLKKDRLDAFLVSSNINIRYLTGFEGTAGILVILRQGSASTLSKSNGLVFKNKAYLLVDSRYTLKAKKEASGVEIVTVTNYLESLSSLLNKKRPCTTLGRTMLGTPCATLGSGLKMGFEEEHLNYKNFRRLSMMLPGTRPYPYMRFIERQRACKDKSEIEIIRKSIEITQNALLSISHFIRPGISEKEIADRLEGYLRRGGARQSSFRTIVAAPQTSSSPHSESGKRVIPFRGMVLVDVGCDFQGYNSDLTRLFLLGKMTAFEKEIVDIVATAQKKAIRAVRVGKRAKDIDQIARQVIQKRGYAKYFGHGLGHGIGLNVHEEPVISKESNTILKEGMVITIEPGIYLPGRFGVRIEDIILVTKKGGRKLTALPSILAINSYI